MKSTLEQNTIDTRLVSTYTVEVSALLIDTYTIEARDADEAHRAASERANRHLRDDGKMLRVSTIVDDPRADDLPAPFA